MVVLAVEVDYMLAGVVVVASSDGIDVCCFTRLDYTGNEGYGLHHDNGECKSNIIDTSMTPNKCNGKGDNVTNTCG